MSFGIEVTGKMPVPLCVWGDKAGTALLAAGGVLGGRRAGAQRYRDQCWSGWADVEGVAAEADGAFELGELVFLFGFFAVAGGLEGGDGFAAFG